MRECMISSFIVMNFLPRCRPPCETSAPQVGLIWHKITSIWLKYNKMSTWSPSAKIIEVNEQFERLNDCNICVMSLEISP